jgi:uncharacterized protein with PQ loop repeat
MSFAPVLSHNDGFETFMIVAGAVGACGNFLQAYQIYLDKASDAVSKPSYYLSIIVNTLNIFYALMVGNIVMLSSSIISLAGSVTTIFMCFLYQNDAYSVNFKSLTTTYVV